MEKFDKDQLAYKNNKIHISQKSVENIIVEYPTPFYLYSQTILEHNYCEFENSSKKHGLNATICFAVKSNNNKFVLRTLAKLGSGADVVSKGELKAALKAGIPADKIVFSGVGKTAKDIKYGLKHGIKSFNVESLAELELINLLANKLNKNVNIAFRLNPMVQAITHKYISTGYKTHKFGLLEEDIIQAINTSKYWSNTKLIGLSVHIGSQLTCLEGTKEAIIKTCECANQIPFKLKFIDVGGGLGVNYKDATKAPSTDFYMETVANALKTYKHQIKIIFEPGRRISASCGFFVTSVIRSKSSHDCNFLIVDGGMNDFIRPSLYDAFHEILPCKNSKLLIKTDIVGPVCETADCFGTKRELPKLKYKDFIVIADTGAYGHTMSSTYNMRKQAREIFLTKKNKLKV